MDVLPTLCLSEALTDNGSNDSGSDCSLEGLSVIGTTASLIAMSGAGADANFTLPPDNLLDFEFDPLERVVSAIVPAFFGVIGVAGLLGNVLVIFGEY